MQASFVRRFLVLSAVALVFGFTQITRAESYSYITTEEEVETTKVSGYKGVIERVEAPGPEWMLYGIEYGEKSDAARFIKGHFIKFNEVLESWDHRGTKTIEASIDSGRPGLGGWKKAAFNHAGQVLHLKAVGAVKVCTTDKKSSSKNKLKGIELFESEVSHSRAEVRKTGDKVSARQTNCDKWHTKRSCPAGTVGVGFEFYYEPLPKRIRGISLQCAKPVSKRLTSN